MYTSPEDIFKKMSERALLQNLSFMMINHSHGAKTQQNTCGGANFSATMKVLGESELLPKSPCLE